jgi:hypothetical protein
MRSIIIAAIAALAFASATDALAAPTSTGFQYAPIKRDASGHCHGAGGRFIACPAPPQKHAPCRDARGKFIKCK